ncbi:hypothetical protein NA56DRAFT_732977 [Hyaloscypha hepaticicola]|uniref:Uncharacterized protein n=1 Tax=Hyaloscypha hepaticicola TaxID=2082293 RepID=A0A2J6QIR4_9HELO|nr:hypothetical protein NA56DRAFT_732977 [Hyaloscypha hepaticicola]
MSRVRPSTLFPFVFSSIAFALVLVLVLSGTNPELIPDGYLLRFNTTNVGKNLIQFSPAIAVTSATPAANAARHVRSAEILEAEALGAGLSNLISKRSIIANSPIPINASTSISSSPTLNSSISTTPSANISRSATSNSNTTPSATPTLVIPQAAVSEVPGAIPIAVIDSFFQLALNAFATGVGDTLQGIITLLVATAKQGVDQTYTTYVSGICQGTVFNASATNLTSPFNITRCVSYSDVGTYFANITSNISDSTLIAAANITAPALSKVPGLGKQAKSLIDTSSSVVLAVYIIGLIGNGLSIILSVAAFVAPSMAPSFGTKIHSAGAGITTLSTQLLQVAAITSTTIAISISTAINNFSDVSGLSASVGGKFLALIWAGYIAAQLANGYWVVTWFVKFRKVAFKARERTSLQMSDYKGILKEIRNDFRVEKADDDYTEVLIYKASDVGYWNNYKRQ